MSNIILAAPDYSDQSLLTASQALGDMSEQNLLKSKLSRIYRTANLTPYIAIDLGEAKAINLAAIVAHNGKGTVKIKAGNTPAVTDYDSGAIDLITGEDVGYSANLCAHYFDQLQTYRYWRFEIDDLNNPDGYFQAGRIYLSNAFVPRVNASYGLSQGFIDNTETKRTRGGEIVPNNREILKQVELELSFMSEDEAFESAYEIDRSRGVAKDILCIENMDNSKHFQRKYIYGRISSIQPIINRSFGLFKKTYTIEEMK